MGRFHVCMPVADGDAYSCCLCNRDMTAELSHYDLDAPDPAAERLSAGDGGVAAGWPYRDLPASPGWD